MGLENKVREKRMVFHSRGVIDELSRGLYNLETSSSRIHFYCVINFSLTRCRGCDTIHYSLVSYIISFDIWNSFPMMDEGKFEKNNIKIKNKSNKSMMRKIISILV